MRLAHGCVSYFVSPSQSKEGSLICASIEKTNSNDEAELKFHAMFQLCCEPRMAQDEGANGLSNVLLY